MKIHKVNFKKKSHWNLFIFPLTLKQEKKFFFIHGNMVRPQANHWNNIHPTLFFSVCHTVLFKIWTIEFPVFFFFYFMSFEKCKWENKKKMLEKIKENWNQCAPPEDNEKSYQFYNEQKKEEKKNILKRKMITENAG